MENWEDWQCALFVWAIVAIPLTLLIGTLMSHDDNQRDRP